jgi:hypothetical protein
MRRLALGYCGARASIKESNYHAATNMQQQTHAKYYHRLPVLLQLLRHAFPLSIFVDLPAIFDENRSLFQCLDQLFRLCCNEY